MTRFKLVFSEAVRSIGANLSTSIAATMTVLIGMLLLGLSIALGSWVVSWSNHVKSELQVQVFFVEGVTPKQVNAVGGYLTKEQQAGTVKEYQFVSKTEALKRMKKKYPQLTANLPSNPLPASFEVTPANANDVKVIAVDLRNQKFVGVEKIKDGQQTSERILQVGKWISYVFVVMVVVLLVASVILIANTIRLSIFSRRREIEVMKLVGATNWFVRGPFMLEGLLCGLVGSIAAVFLLFIGKQVALPAILGHIDTTDDVQALSFGLTALALIAVGLGVGALGSGMTLRRFLKV